MVSIYLSQSRQGGKSQKEKKSGRIPLKMRMGPNVLTSQRCSHSQVLKLKLVPSKVHEQDHQHRERHIESIFSFIVCLSVTSLMKGERRRECGSVTRPTNLQH